MSDDILQRAKDALDGVSDGPWRWEPSKYLRSGYVITAQSQTAVHATEWGNTPDEQFNHTDAKFAAAARTLVPELIAEVEQLRTDLEACQRLIRNVELLEALLAADEEDAVEIEAQP